MKRLVFGSWDGARNLIAVLRPRFRRGKVLAVKLGYNPNSSSLGADVTFLLLGTAAVSVLGPVIAAAVRLALRKRPPPPPANAGEEEGEC